MLYRSPVYNTRVRTLYVWVKSDMYLIGSNYIVRYSPYCTMLPYHLRELFLERELSERMTSDLHDLWYEYRMLRGERRFR